MKKKSLVGVILSYAANCKGKMILSVVSAVLSVFGGIVPFFGVYNIIKLFIDGLPTHDGIIFWSLITLGGYAAKLLFHMISTMLAHVSAYTILENLRLRITQRLMNAPLGTVLDDSVGRIKSTIVDKVEEIEIPLAHVIPELFSNMLLPIAVFVYICVIDWRMALASLATLPIAFISSAVMMKSFNKLYHDYMKASDHVNSVIVEYIEGIEVIKAFNQSAGSYEKFAHSIKSFKDFTLAWYESAWPMMNLTLSVLPSSLLATVPVGILLYLNGSLAVAEFAICLIMSLGVVAPFMKFTQFVNDIKAIEYAVRAADKYLTIEELSDSEKEVRLNHHDISFRNVGFSYSGNDNEKVLQNIDLDITEGSFTALVGPSGGGKSTIARMIARFWDVDTGSVKIGGVDVRDIPLNQLMEITSYVTQDNFLFDCSLKENIRMGNPEAGDEEVFRAARAAQCSDFISRLEKGYDTPAGEAGRRLSGGEKQRIAIARAMLKSAPIVLLDEATAFTDPENEEKIQKSISALTKGKTLLVIAHRLSTIKNADQIILIDKGNVVRSGTHTELLETSSLYSSMWQAHISSKNWSTGRLSEVETNV